MATDLSATTESRAGTNGLVALSVPMSRVTSSGPSHTVWKYDITRLREETLYKRGLKTNADFFLEMEQDRNPYNLRL